MALEQYVAHNFEVGDVVLLKSGGPLMTVTECRIENIAVIFWHDDDYRDGCFIFETLERYNKLN